MKAERDIMTKIRHPFIVGLSYAFQTPAKVYLVMPYVSGGELFNQLHKQGLLLEVYHTIHYKNTDIVAYANSMMTYVFIYTLDII